MSELAVCCASPTATDNPPVGDMGTRARSNLATRTRLLLAAERLFSERGVDAVSLREITVAARQGNINAAQYHFGNKERIVQALFEFRSSQFEIERSDMLARLGEAGRLDDAKSLIQILCYPYLRARSEDGRFSFAAFMCQYLIRLRPTGTPHPTDQILDFPSLTTLRTLLVDRLSHLDAALARRRVAMCSLTFCSMLVRWETGNAADRAIPFEAMVADTVEQLAGALCAPATSGQDMFPDYNMVGPSELPTAAARGGTKS